jgi:hypothetical protein
MIPILAVVPTVVIAVCMHSEWIRLGTDASSVQAVIAGDALYGSGLVVLGLWLSVGLWIGSLMVNRSLMISIASVLSVLVSIVVGLYAVFVWAGGRLLNWLVPAKLDKWTAVSVEPQLYIVFIATAIALAASVLGLFPRMHRFTFSLGTKISNNSSVYVSDFVGGGILFAIIVSIVWQLL